MPELMVTGWRPSGGLLGVQCVQSVSTVLLCLVAGQMITFVKGNKGKEYA